MGTNYLGSALDSQEVAERTPSEVMVGGLVKVSPEDAAARKLSKEQEKRRRSAVAITHVYRSKRRPEDPHADDGDDEEEIEVSVDGEWEGRDESVGIMRGGFICYGTATRIDNGAEIALTEDEKQRIVEDAEERAASDAEDYDDRDDG